MHSVDDKETDVIPDKIEEKLIEKLKINDNENNEKKIIRIIKQGIEFNKELKNNSHVF